MELYATIYSSSEPLCCHWQLQHEAVTAATIQGLETTTHVLERFQEGLGYIQNHTRSGPSGSPLLYIVARSPCRFWDHHLDGPLQYRQFSKTKADRLIRWLFQENCRINVISVWHVLTSAGSTTGVREDQCCLMPHRHDTWVLHHTGECAFQQCINSTTCITTHIEDCLM